MPFDGHRGVLAICCFLLDYPVIIMHFVMSVNTVGQLFVSKL